MVARCVVSGAEGLKIKEMVPRIQIEVSGRVVTSPR